MKISEILNSVNVIQVIGNPEKVEVKAISNNSNEIEEGYVFVAIKGMKKDGHEFIPEAISKKAAAIILEDDKLPDEIFLQSNCVKILVKNSRKAFAQFATALYSDPSAKLNLIGITGTKGKTTTAFMIKQILDFSGNECGLLGTIANYIGKDEIPAKLTTPETNVINEFLGKMVERGSKACVMEVSSHSLELYRTEGLKFSVAVFTNITSDHFDFHKTFESYLSAKKKLFDQLSESANIVYNLDDLNSGKLLSNSKAKKYSYGMNPDADFVISDIRYDLNGTAFKIKSKLFEEDFTIPLIGVFNAYNAAAAIITSFVFGIKIEIIKEAIAKVKQVPGRFEVIKNKKKTVIVDYSHTTDSLRQALQAVHHLTKGEKIYCVFGCGGDRDKLKRPEMGEAAAELSDFVFVTSDNPRDEEPMSIINDIITGIKKSNYAIEEKREEAIRRAICESEENAVILIAGKGHENYQEIHGIRKYFSDRETAIKYLERC